MLYVQYAQLSVTSYESCYNIVFWYALILCPITMVISKLNLCAIEVKKNKVKLSP
jgi:hypothetical protein